MWYRVFSMTDLTVQPAEIQACLESVGINAPLHVTGDDLGWASCEVRLAADSILQIDRYLTDADDLREELNSWTAWLEAQAQQPNHEALTQRVVNTMQMFTLQSPSPGVEELCKGVMLFLAGHTDGVVQIDGQGFFTATGKLLLQER